LFGISVLNINTCKHKETPPNFGELLFIFNTDGGPQLHHDGDDNGDVQLQPCGGTDDADRFDNVPVLLHLQMCKQRL
jgi:hypothetical protein